MVYPFLPLIDDTNPLYCPDLSASEFLAHYRPRPDEDLSDVSSLSFYSRISICVEEGSLLEHAGCANPALALPTRFPFNAREKPYFDSDSSSFNASFGLRDPPRHAKSNLSHSETSFILTTKAERLQFSSVGFDSSVCQDMCYDSEDSDISAGKDRYSRSHFSEQKVKHRTSDSRNDEQQSIEGKSLVSDPSPNGTFCV